MTCELPSVEVDDDPIILVVEDEWLVRVALVDGLRDAGLTVIEAASGAEAITYLQSGAPVDLVFTDVQMPGPIDGLALLDHVNRTISSVPVIVTSGHLEPGAALHAGAADFVIKPYSASEVADLIYNKLGMSR